MALRTEHHNSPGPRALLKSQVSTGTPQLVMWLCLLTIMPLMLLPAFTINLAG
jgi:hypothetical protein